MTWDRICRLVGLVGITVFLVAAFTPLPSVVDRWVSPASQLERADAIVVLGGGVGESGQAGQGHEERVRRAIDLYRAGWAPRLIMSSGFVRIFREAEVMRALAVADGVPSGAIDLEETARSTHDNVRFVDAILQRRQASTVLLVSSPYHMRRVLAVFRRQTPGVRVIPVPVSSSSFYAHRWGASPRQIRGIVHEYAAFLYYWWKGWL